MMTLHVHILMTYQKFGAVISVLVGTVVKRRGPGLPWQYSTGFVQNQNWLKKDTKLQPESTITWKVFTNRKKCTELTRRGSINPRSTAKWTGAILASFSTEVSAPSWINASMAVFCSLSTATCNGVLPSPSCRLISNIMSDDILKTWHIRSHPHQVIAGTGAPRPPMGSLSQVKLHYNKEKFTSSLWCKVVDDVSKTPWCRVVKGGPATRVLGIDAQRIIV